MGEPTLLGHPEREGTPEWKFPQVHPCKFDLTELSLATPIWKRTRLGPKLSKTNQNRSLTNLGTNEPMAVKVGSH
jgi:hypothetical protein